MSHELGRRLDAFEKGQTVSRQEREAALAKLMEGQRHVWSMRRTRSNSRIAAAIQAGRNAFKQAVELDPTLAEGYTALAELEIAQQPGDAQVNEALALARLATRVGPDNFGARRIMARLYSYQSRLGSTSFDKQLLTFAEKEWGHVARLDPRNAEAWAFLSAIYERQGKREEEIDALRKWVGAATPLDTQFYRMVMGSQENLSSENASMKLGSALLEAGKVKEAVETFSAIVADSPGNLTAVELLREALDSAEGPAAETAIESLTQAVYANPDNISLVNLLARVYSRAGKDNDAERLYTSAVERLMTSDRAGAADIQVEMADMLLLNGDHAAATAAYEKAFAIRGLDEARTLAPDERIFAMRVLEKLITLYKGRNDDAAVEREIARARKLFGNEDLFADRQLITYYRESGRRDRALVAVKAARSRAPDDIGFIRLEATLLTEAGRVDEAVAGIRKLNERVPDAAGSRNTVTIGSQDEYSNLLFISHLYTVANRSKEAADAANEAFKLARGTERKQIAQLTLATAQNRAGDFAAAEATLRGVLAQSPGNPIALNNLGYFLIQRGERTEEAKKMIEEAVKVDPTNPSYLDSLGWAHFKLGNLAEAERYLKEAAKFDPSSATIQEHLGDVYKAQDKAGQARESWERALRLAADAQQIERLKQKLAVR
ncbi:MAG TPA: tetratricopeptide repeat protein [Pyrinomonadaceae bacterium]|nr:tetratricopeptide repeat protein [Pyrinomonadaceae bacterium]